MQMNQDFLEFIKLLNIHNAEYVVIGAYARSFYGRPRYTGDIDFFISTSRENAERMMRVLNDFGFGSLGISIDDFMTPGQTIQLGVEPRRIDLLTGISGVEFCDAWKNRESIVIDGVAIQFISREDYIRNKKASGRHKDLADIEDM